MGPSVNAGCELCEGGISGWCGAVRRSNCVVGRTFLSGRTERGGEIAGGYQRTNKQTLMS